MRSVIGASVTAVRSLASEVGARPANAPWSGADELTAAADVVTSGRLLQLTVSPVVAQVSRAWGPSRTRRMCLAALNRWRMLADWQRVQLIGVTVLAAALTDVVLRRLDPRPASGLRLWVWGAVVFTGLTLAAHARIWTSAWRRRRDRP